MGIFGYVLLEIYWIVVVEIVEFFEFALKYDLMDLVYV